MLFSRLQRGFVSPPEQQQWTNLRKEANELHPLHFPRSSRTGVPNPVHTKESSPPAPTINSSLRDQIFNYLPISWQTRRIELEQSQDLPHSPLPSSLFPPSTINPNL